MIKLGCCISYEHVELAKQFGYDFIELSASSIMCIPDTAWEGVKQRILQADIPVIGFNAFCDAHNPLVGPHVNTTSLTLYLEKVIKRAHELHAMQIGIGAPQARFLPSGYSYTFAQQQMADFLKMASTMAAPFGIQILYEAINPIQCNFGTTTKEVGDTVTSLQLSNLHLVWDVYHAINAQETYQEVVPYLSTVTHVHLCSWDQDLNRFYLFEKDRPYVEEVLSFLHSYQYDKSISIEALDADFEQRGKSSIEMLRALLNAM